MHTLAAGMIIDNMMVQNAVYSAPDSLARDGAPAPSMISFAPPAFTGPPPTITGSNGNDTINGTGGIDSIYAYDGDDTVNARGGDDYIDGGDGDDYIRGRGGNDTIVGGAGADVIDGDNGIDTVDYSAQVLGINVNLNSGSASGGDANGDTLIQIENVIGGSGNDIITGAAGNNELHGGAGNDTLDGAGGNDVIYGGDGADVINGGDGNDTLYGTAQLNVDAILASNSGVFYYSATGSFYQFINTGARISRTDADSAATAATLNGTSFVGHLATITSAAETAFIDGIRDNSNAWIAGTDSVTEGEWIWDRGQSAGIQFADENGNSVNGHYVDWVAGQPNDGDGTQDYLYLYDNNGTPGWADAPDNPWLAIPNFVDIFSYIIEWDAGPGADDNAADTINGGDGDDVIHGYGGGDNLSGGIGADTIYGGAGNDTINGDGGNDTLYGGDGDDIINGGGNNDNIYGGAGADTINGGANNDTVFYTSETTDIIIDLNGGVGVGGEAQGDTLTSIENLYSGSGNDIITGSTANNDLYGGAGNDTIRGGDGNDNIYGQNGDDTFYAENGNDFFYGGDGFDTIIFSGNFADYSYTTPGIVGNTYAFTFTDNNTSDGNDGVDYIESVELLIFNDITIDISDPNNIRYAPVDIAFSNDRINYNDAIGTTIATMTTTDYDGGPHTYTFLGGDTGFFTISGNEIRLNADVSGFKNQIFYLSVQTEDGDGLTYSEDYFVTILGDTTTITNDTDDTINGNSDDEALYGYGGDDIINGGDGDDEIFGGAGADTMDGGAGFDVVRFDTATNDLIINLTTSTVNGGGIAAGDTFINFEGAAGGIGNDTIIGTSGKNSLYGNRGNDIINGGAGDDKIWGGAGADIMDGGDGLDFLRYDYDVVGVNVNLGTGAASGGQATGDVFTNFEGVTGGFGDDMLTGGAGNDRLSGNDGNDILTGGAGRDVIQGGNGNDVINAGDDNDNVYGGMGADIMDGGAGKDTLRYEADIAGVSVNLFTGIALGGEATGDVFQNFENVNGGYGNDTLIGDSGKNVINGRDGNDTIDGAGGNDNLYGDDGDDIIYGGAGNDNIWGGAGADQIDGGTGTDTLRYTDDNTGMTINLTTGVGSGGYAQGDTYTNIENVFAGNGDDIITGDAGRNTIRGYGGNDIIHGGDDKDNIDGGKGDDILYGGASDDTLNGDDGNDILYGGDGIDTLTGGDGADTFVFDDLSSSDRIRDFNAAEGDILDISSLLSGFTGGSDIHEFLQFTEDRGRTRVMVDADGAANSENFVQAAVMDNLTGLDIDTLYTNGQIITI